MSRSPLTVTATIAAPLERVWECWTDPAHITQWAFASDDWEAPSAENDVRTGGTFKTVMAAKDGSASFDFSGTYTDVRPLELIEYDMEDGRHVKTTFEKTDDGVVITQTFDPEGENPDDVQIAGWQATLDNFKKHTESH